MKNKYDGSLGNALAGHSYRVSNSLKQKEYDNPFTDWIDRIIKDVKEENKTKESTKDDN